VRSGDTFFLPAGTIHAIGAGLVLCEIQQFSDATYRLFDYHRQPERPLHLEDALAVAHLAPAESYRRATPIGEGRQLLAACGYFRTERLYVSGSAECPASMQPAIYVAIAGEGSIAGEPFRAGEAWLAPAGTTAFAIESADAAFVIADGPA
jgi:mannose-6-phosphate isomerase